ncbi:MAG TPA: D-2-hydroxyacid dehydrogenase [Bryobacteraceae bacterium]|nr:D-2-hydroxyacid dehydrogenase [Bryobacteraceae bacterium]
MDDITVLVLAHPAEPMLAMLERLPERTSIAVGETPEAFANTAARADVILYSSADLAVFEQVWRMAPRVKWVHSLSAGLDGTLFPALAASPVPLTNARSAFSEALGEFAIGAIFFFAKNFRRMVCSQMAGVWDQFDTIEVRGQTVGIVGYGDLGRAVAWRAHALGMKVLALRRRPERSAGDPYLDKIYSLDQMQELLTSSDYIVVSTPLTSESRGLIGKRQVDAMKPAAVLINIGRGPVVDEPALVEALQQKRLRGAALDVFETEPLPAGHPFYRLENVLLSPHAADHTPDWKACTMRVFLENFERFRRGEPLANVVDKQLGY